MRKMIIVLCAIVCMVIPYRTVYAGSDIADGNQHIFEYTGASETLIIPKTGIYKIEVYGAQGASYGNKTGGKGGYVSAYVQLNKGTTLTYVIGGKNGYNGGGAASEGGTGGGATSVSIADTLIIGAGGGGGASTYSNGGIGEKNNDKIHTTTNGETGLAGGGGGWNGGKAAIVVKHIHDGNVTTGGKCYNTQELTSKPCGAMLTPNGDGTSYCAKCDVTVNGDYNTAHKIMVRTYIMDCGYNEGEIESYTCSYGGLNYVNTQYCNSVIEQYGKREGNGLLVITLTQEADDVFPVISEVTLSTLSSTKENVTATIVATDNTGIGGYLCVPKGDTSADNPSTVWNPGATFTITANGIYDFWVKDLAGNKICKRLEITNIDKTAPVISSVELSETSWTNKDVIITVNASDDTGSVQYSIDNGKTWKTQNRFTITTNGSYTVIAKDAVENQTKATVKITNIDRTAPVLTVMVPDVTDVKVKSVTIRYEAIDDAGIAGYAVSKDDSLAWSNITVTKKQAEVTENGIYYVYAADVSGNVTKKAVEITNFTNSSNPVIQKVTTTLDAEYIYNNRRWAKKATVQIVAADTSILHNTPYKFGSNNWSSNNKYTFTQNGVYTVKLRNASGDEVSESVVIDMLDNEPPVLTKIIQSQNETEFDITEPTPVTRYKNVKIIAEDAGCGIKDYRISRDNNTWSRWQTENLFKDLHLNGTYYVQIRDNFKNTTSITFELKNLSEMFDVTYIDLNEYGDTLGTTTREVRIGQGISGADLGIDETAGAYYQGYVFINCTSAIVSESKTNVVYRHFKLQRHNVIFCDANGNRLKELRVAHGNSIAGVTARKETKITSTKIISYEFSHWEDASGEEVDMSKVVSDMELYPVFTEIEQILTPQVTEGSVEEEDIGYISNITDVTTIDISQIGKDVEYIETEKEEEIKEPDVVIKFEDVDISDLLDKSKDKNIFKDTYETIKESKVAKATIPVVSSVGGTIAAYSIVSLLLKYLTGAGLSQSIIFLWALITKKRRYVKGAWLLSEQDMQYVDKYGRKLDFERNEYGKYIFSRKGKPVTGADVEQLIELLNNKKITYDEFEKRISQSQVYTSFSKDVQLEVWNVKQANTVTNKRAKGFDLSKTIKNTIQKTGDYSVRINNSGKMIVVNLKFIARNL